MFRYDEKGLSIKKTTNAVYEKFISNREYFRMIIAFDERNIGHERGEVQGFLHYHYGSQSGNHGFFFFILIYQI